MAQGPDPRQIEQAIKEALNQGINPEEIAQGLAQQLGIKPEEAAQLVAAVQQQGGGATPADAAAEPTGSPQIDGISLEEAMSQIEQLGIEPDVALAFINIIMSMRPSDIDDLAEMIQSGGQAAQQEAGAQPSEEEVMAAGQI